MLLLGLVLPGTKARSGMKAPKGTFMKRLLSINQTEQTGACASAAVPPRTASPIEAVTNDASNRSFRPSLVIAFPPLLQDLR